MTRARGTAMGALAIVAWSFYGVLLAFNEATPPFLSMAIAFTAATLALFILRLARGQGLTGLFPMPLSTLALGFTGLFGSNVLFIVALALGGEPVSVNVASLSWPVFMAGLVVAFGVARATWLDAVAVATGFSGVVLLATGGKGLSLDLAVLPALAGALCWAVMSALRTRVPVGPRDPVLHFAGLSAIVCWAVVLLHEGVGLPPADELLRLAVVGALPMGLANHLWDIATRHGDQVLLVGMSFVEPVISTALIAVILSRPVGFSDAAALALALAALLLSLLSERRRRRSTIPPRSASPS